MYLYITIPIPTSMSCLLFSRPILIYWIRKRVAYSTTKIHLIWICNVITPIRPRKFFYSFSFSLNKFSLDHLFSLKFTVKEFERNSKKCDKEEKAERAKLKKAIQKGNMEVARIHGENAIRQKNQSLNFLRMAARIDAVSSRVQTAVTTKKVHSSNRRAIFKNHILTKYLLFKVTQSMAGVVKAMDSAMRSMNLEKISALMDKFEKQFEDLDVQSSCMDTAMSQTTTTSVPQNDVDFLMQQVADEAG